MALIRNLLFEDLFPPHSCFSVKNFSFNMEKGNKIQLFSYTLHPKLHVCNEKWFKILSRCYLKISISIRIIPWYIFIPIADECVRTCLLTKWIMKKIHILCWKICPSSLGRISGWVHQMPAMFLKAGVNL